MNNQRYIAFALIATGAIALASRFGGGTGWLWNTGWLWVGLVAAGFLMAYSRKRTYRFLVAGSILAGIAAGLLLEQIWGWDGIFLIGLGLGFFAIDQVERRPNRWPRIVAAILIGLGLLSGLSDSGIFGSVWFAIALIAGGIYLLQRGDWVLFPPSQRPIPDPPAPEPEAPPEEAVREAPVPEEEPEPEETPEVKARLERLEIWRQETAEAEGRAPYLILNNQTLIELADANPQTREELQAIRGIGPVKLDRYGEQLLEVLSND